MLTMKVVQPRILFTLLLLWMAVVPSLARAESFQVGDAQIELPIPEGYCAMSRDDQSDLLVFNIFDTLNAGTNRVLMIFADCAKLDAFRKGSSDDSGYAGFWLAQLNPVTQQPYRIDLTPEQFIGEVAQVLSDGTVKIEDLEKNVNDRLGDIAEKLQTNANISGTQMTLLNKTDRVLYLALTADAVAGNQSIRNAGVTGMTMIKSYPVSINIYRPYESSADFELLHGIAEKTMQQALMENAPVSQASAEPLGTTVYQPASAGDAVVDDAQGNNIWFWVAISVAALVLIGGIAVAIRKRR